jgi:NAD(P)H dehydrogenase (quinone)
MENKQNPTVLVLGASGTIGRQVIKDLEGQAVNVRITSRKQEVVDQLTGEGKDCVYLDLDDPRTFALALAGVDRVFLLTGYTVAMLTQSKTLVDAAKKAGVRHIVHVGVFAEWDTTDAHFAWHQMIEKYIEASGIAWTHLHPNMFMEVFTGLYIPKNLTYTGYWEDRRIGYIASSDIAAMAAKALLSDVTGLEIKYENKGLEGFKEVIEQIVANGGESWYANANIEFVTQMLDGRMSYMSMVQNDIPYVLGRPAKTLREFLEEHKAAIVESAESI